MKRLATLKLLLLVSVAVVPQSNEYNAIYLVDGNSDKEVYRSHVTLESYQNMENVVRADNGTKLTLTSMNLNKTSGICKDSKLRHSEGVNAVALATNGSTLVLENCRMVSHAQNADVVVAGKGQSKVKVISPVINMSRDNSAGFNALNSGTIEASNVNITTAAFTSPAFLTQVGGKIVVENAEGTLRGADSPIAYSSGDISIKGGRMLTYNSHIATVNSTGKLTLEDVLYYGYRYYGFQLYSKDTRTDRKQKGALTLTNSSFTISEGPMFYVSNTDVEVTIENVKFSMSRKAPFIQAAAGDWGTEGTNGGHIVVNLNNQDIAGDIDTDEISTVKLVLNEKSSFKGAINRENKGQASIVLSDKALWIVTADTYLKTIEFATTEESIEKALKKINSKGHNIYYDASNEANAPLQGKSYPLKGGGSLLTY